MSPFSTSFRKALTRGTTLVTRSLPLKVLLIGLFILPSVCFADSWDRYDYSLYGAYSVVTYVDWRQTQYIARHPESFSETNKKIGEHPSISTVNNYFWRKAVMETSLAYILPGWWRKSFLGGITIDEFNAAHPNKSLRVKFSFYKSRYRTSLHSA